MNRRIVMVLAALALLRGQISLFAADTATISREQLVDRVKKAATLPAQVPGVITKDARDALVDKVKGRIGALAPESLPARLEGFNQALIDRATEEGFPIEYNNDKYIDLSIQQHFDEIRVRLALEIMYPPLSDKDQAAVKASLKPVLDGVRQSLHTHLLGDKAYFTTKEIDDCADGLERSLYGRIPDPDTYAGKLPLAKADGARLLADFDSRLAQSVDRIGPRLNQANGRNGAGNPAGNQFEKEMILEEVITSIQRQLLDLTTDPARKPDITKIAPDYSKISEELSQLEDELDGFPPMGSATEP